MALDCYGRHHFLCRLGLPNLLQAFEYPHEGFRQQRSTGRSASTRSHWRGEGSGRRSLQIGAQFVENNLVYLTSRSGLFCSCRYMQAFIIRPVLSMFVNSVRRLVDSSYSSEIMDKLRVNYLCMCITRLTSFGKTVKTLINNNNNNCLLYQQYYNQQCLLYCSLTQKGLR
jgi:hypothetical protein